MKAVVLAAGRGTRLRHLTDSKPKPLVEVAGKPLLTHCFERLSGLGIEEAVVVVGYRGELIRQYYGSSYRGLPIEYAVQDEQNGVADALLSAEGYVDDDFLVTYGDVVFGVDLERCLDRHREVRPHATLLAMDLPRQEARGSGVCVLEGGDLVGLEEKPDDPPSTLGLPGFFVFSQSIFRACHLVQPSDRGEYELPEAIDLLIHAGCSVETVEVDGWRVNVNTPEDRRRAERLLTSGSASQ